MTKMMESMNEYLILFLEKNIDDFKAGTFAEPDIKITKVTMKKKKILFCGKLFGLRLTRDAGRYFKFEKYDIISLLHDQRSS
jgi:hypothetical protein